MNVFEPNLDRAQERATQDFTTLLDIYATTDDESERELIAHVLRICGAYVAEMKRQKQRLVIADSNHGYTLDMLFAYARQAIYALDEFPRSTQGMQTMRALLNDAVAFLRVVH